MKFSLNQHTLLALWVPGFVVVMILLAARGPSYVAFYDLVTGQPTAVELIAVLVFAVCAGEALDVIRDLLEHLWDLLQPMGWQFLVKGPEHEVVKFEDRYFTYYVFDINICLALIIALMVQSRIPSWVTAILLLIFALNAFTLRCEMAALTKGYL